jgi:hypothetical protein
MNAKHLKSDLNVIEFLKSNKYLAVRNKGRSDATNAKLFAAVEKLIEQGLVKKEMVSKTSSGQVTIIVKSI